MSSSALANRYSARMGDILKKPPKHRPLRASPRWSWWWEPTGTAFRGIRSIGQDEPGDEDNASQPGTRWRSSTFPAQLLQGMELEARSMFMAFDVIPFYEVKSIWIGKCNDERCLDYEHVKRAYSKCVENEICPGFVGSSQESALMFLQNITGVIEGSPETEAGADNLHNIKDMVDRACAVS